MTINASPLPPSDINDRLSDWIVEMVQSATAAPSSDKHFRHSQSNPFAVWEINHGLGKYPSVSIVDSAKSAVIGEVQYLDENRLTVSFSAAFSGEAFLN